VSARSALGSGGSETAARHLASTVHPSARQQRTRADPQGTTMKRRLTLLSLTSALLVLAAHPAFAGYSNMGF
jgi:hypothetical protein